ncbi:MAG: aminotransferase class V-fold PLP-dependent enzyme [Planctomycetota bacterium]|jgi:cysteine desulfurase family protein
MDEKQDVIYLDHGATSWPKPEAVREKILSFSEGVCANVGRSGHRASVESARAVFECREKTAHLLGISDSTDVIFTRGATEGINLVLKGFLRHGDAVLATPMEHNAVSRPLNRLKRALDLRVGILPADPLGAVDWDAARSVAGGQPIRLVVVCHGSNVNGVVQDLEAARAAFPKSALLVDAAQTAGVLPLSAEKTGIDFLACSAHKGLLGPTGVGVCYLHPKYEVKPLMEGGTGSRSEETDQPAFRPDMYESGTLNIHGILAFSGALDHLEREGLNGDHKRELTGALIEGFRGIPRVRLHSPVDGTALLLAFTVEGMTSDQVARDLEEECGILCRPGLHCSPMAHRHLGTHPEGAVRLAPGWGNTEEHMRIAVEGLRKIAAR